ncbi:hypothetical protein JR316_0008434 [Psilocybe cubensis]|uniref:Uncharacterized protein n=1 Tax=Psilocybe cubensis TaxID=181762 RepID=A0ACB8GXV6_PSICU|nr:hypothetical protein JR316_0008434 [Psilocybe cubensis]KAH9479839.1 hypothetical protein JR316_0008434 [Psilocybe cubensis]
MSDLITFDDIDTDHLKYEGHWQQGNWNASDLELSGTLSSTDELDATFTFVLLYSVTFDTPGIHTITIINQPDFQSDGNTLLTIDRIVLKVPDPSTTGSSPTSPSSTSTHAASRSSVPVNAIVGGVIGALVTIVLAFWLYIRRRRARRTDHLTESSRSRPFFIQPLSRGLSFLLPSRELTTAMSATATKIFGWDSSAAVGSAGASSRRTRRGRGAGHAGFKSNFFPDSTPSSRVGDEGSSSSALLLTVGPRRERDAGPAPVLDEEEEEAEEGVLPPDYGDVFVPSRNASAIAGAQHRGRGGGGVGSRRSRAFSASVGLLPVRRESG